MPESDDRAPHGRPMLDDGANLTDALVLLTKVNHLSVVRILAAMDAIRKTEDIDWSERIDFLSDVPTERPDPKSSDPEHVARCNAAVDLCQRVAADSRNERYSGILHLSRFRASGGRK